jgi:hypothetical protein
MSQQTERERCEDVGSPFSPPAIKSEAGKDRQTHVRTARSLEYIAGRVGQIRRRLDEEQGSVGSSRDSNRRMITLHPNAGTYLVCDFRGYIAPEITRAPASDRYHAKTALPPRHLHGWLAPRKTLQINTQTVGVCQAIPAHQI